MRRLRIAKRKRQRLSAAKRTGKPQHVADAMDEARERFERERAAHYAKLRERKRTRGTHQDQKRNDARRSDKPKPDNGSHMWEARTLGEAREDLSHLYAELHNATDPTRREEIELEIFRMTGEVRK